MFNVLDRVGYVGLRGPTSVYVRLLREQNPLLLSVEVGGIGCLQPHVPRPPPTPPHQNRGRTTHGNGNVMLQSFLSKTFGEGIGGRYPCAASVVETEQKGSFVAYFLHSRAQMCFYQTLGSRQPHITAVL